jgi:hypothetical protein
MKAFDRILNVLQLVELQKNHLSGKIIIDMKTASNLTPMSVLPEYAGVFSKIPSYISPLYES